MDFLSFRLVPVLFNLLPATKVKPFNMKTGSRHVLAKCPSVIPCHP